MQVLGCLFMILFAGFFLLLSLGFSVLDGILRLLGFSRRRPTARDENNSTPTTDSKSKTFFNDKEGEYIDFEEV